MKKYQSNSNSIVDVIDAEPYEYGALSSRYRLYAKNKFTAYATMVLHYNQSNHLVVIYSPEECKNDMWTSFSGKIAKRLDEIFGGEGAFDKYLLNNINDIRECYQSIETTHNEI